ncbi:hypothetical protein OQB66_08380 [Pseudomonas syringae]|uniref:hypothetical protein n=1 Tax=Pseudomonas syringae TaxID=317 RepID=UPI00224AE45E|nr:hypothetical protein [Pseudomonas syringae]UZS74309.1 hypothetical protein OQB66_08380 [Pseudomonas syringae]
MISLELSMVRHNMAESARLAEAVEAFMRKGGSVLQLESGIVRPDAVAMKYNSSLFGPDCKTSSMQRLRIIPDIQEAQAKSAEKAKRKSPAKKPTTEEDLKLVARIRAMRDLGITRKQACKHMQISSTLMTRLILDYGIDYPKAVNRFK